MLGIKAKPTDKTTFLLGYHIAPYDVDIGIPLSGVRKMDLHFAPDEIVTASLEMSVGEIEIEGVMVDDVRLIETSTGRKFILEKIE